MRVSVRKDGQLQGRFAVLMVTTLERLLLGGQVNGGDSNGHLQLLVVERRPLAMLSALFDGVRGRLGRNRTRGVHLERSEEITIEGERSSLILDGELFESSNLRPIVLRPTQPMPFLSLAA
jgi:hypothetical protein